MHPQIRVQAEGVVLHDAQYQIVLAHKIGGEMEDVHHPAGEEESDLHRAEGEIGEAHGFGLSVMALDSALLW